MAISEAEELELLELEEAEYQHQRTLKPKQSNTTELESGARGVGQGLSFGSADEISGGVEALWNKAQGNPEAFADLYSKYRDESRSNFKEAEEANPKSYIAGEITGAIAPAFLTGGTSLGASVAARTATMGGRVAMAAAGGALQGAGLSEADNFADLAKDTAIGGTLGAVTQGVGEKVIAPLMKSGAGLASKAASQIDGASDWVAKKTGKVLASVPEEYTERYLSNPKAVNEAFSREELAQNLMDEGGGFDLLRERLSKLDSEAWKELGTEAKYKRAEMLDAMHSVIKNDMLNPKDILNRTEGSGGSLRKLNAIQKELEDINKAYGSKISESDIKSMVQDLQKVAYSDAGSPRTAIGAEGVRELSGRLNDVIKTTNTNYAAKMEPVAESTRLMKDLERNFVNQQDPAGYDKFFDKLKRWQSSDPSSAVKQSISDLDKFTGTTMSEDINNTLAKQAFSKSDTNGSRKTMLGTIVGGAAGSVVGGPIGGVVGGALGAAAGQTADKYAGAVFKNMLDGKIATEEAMRIIGPQLGKYAKPLSEAAKRGAGSLAATHFILTQTDPEYKKLTTPSE